MPDLQLLLEDALERLPEPATPPFETIVGRARRRRTRRLLGASAAVAAVVVAGALALPHAFAAHQGTAIIVPAHPTVSPSSSAAPGTRVLTPLAAPVQASHSGTADVALGPPPSGANALSLELTCLSSGTFHFADGESEQCRAGDVGNAAVAEVAQTVIPLQPGQHSTRITAAAGLRWSLVATYVKATIQPLGVNASGQTYGTTAFGAKPDLVAVVATNGKEGYVYANGVAAPTPANPSQALAWQRSPQPPKVVPVYESDGKTQIGEFRLTPAVPTSPPRSP